MGKIILQYDSDEEREEARTALDAYKWKGAVWDIDQELRKITKNGYVGQREATEEEIALAERLREELRRILDDFNLNLD